MSHRIDDRWLWLSVGLSLIIAFKGIKFAITDTVRLTQVKPLGKDQDEELQRQPEDSIPIEVLQTLTTSPNPNISKCASDIVLSRCVINPTLISEIQADASSSNLDLRRRARLALRLLGSWSLGGDDRGHAVPAGMRTGGSTGALNLSPSILSQENPFDFDRGVSLPPRMAAQLYDQGGVVEMSGRSNGNGWATAALDGDGEWESDVRRRQRNREAVVMQAGSEVLDGLEEDLIARPS